MTERKPTIHSTWLTLRQPANFKPFFEALTEYLKEHMVKEKIGGSYEYYTCVREHCSSDPEMRTLQASPDILLEGEVRILSGQEFHRAAFGAEHHINRLEIVLTKMSLRMLRPRFHLRCNFGGTGRINSVKPFGPELTAEELTAERQSRCPS